MIESSVDIAVLGSGFGGSLMSLIPQRIGRSVVLVDRAAHPRFAIGESSTPIADYILSDLADRYDLPRLKPLARYGTWKETYPQIGCGLKRGFSYFHHQSGCEFVTDHNHSTELLVAASSSDEHADTHWLRSDVDAFLVNEARAAGVEVLEQTHLTEFVHDNGWILRGQRLDEPVEIRARFVIDATGPAGIIPRFLGINDDGASLRTNSRAIFGHFTEVWPWQDILSESQIDTSDYPFSCDAAAQHHVLEDAWMWQLRFDNGITSAGLVFDRTTKPLDPAARPDDEWCSEITKYPSIARQFENAKLIQPDSGLQRTDRLQRRVRLAAGDDWALLPSTAGFIDPLHSTGIAHTLSGIERLSTRLERYWNRPELTPALRQYSEQLNGEFSLIDELVEGCYATRFSPRAFAAWSMLYFAAATTCEKRRVQSGPESWSFLCSTDDTFSQAVKNLRSECDHVRLNTLADSEFEQHVRQAIRDYNTVGLCDEGARNMYRYTSAPVTEHD